MSIEWYENPAWDKAAELDFRKRLSRATVHKDHYLKLKIAAIAEHHPRSAISLCKERRESASRDNGFGAAYAQSCIHARLGEVDNMFSALRHAIGKDGLALGAPAAGEFCCLVGYFDKPELFPLAFQVLDKYDKMAMNELGRPFKSFAMRAAHALLNYRSGHRDEAIEPAKDALELALEQRNPIFGVLENNSSTHAFPSPLHDMLLVAANLWDERKLGKPPLK